MRKSQYFQFQFWVLNKGTTGIIFITSLVWRGPWQGIEPGTSRTRSQHSTTRISRRRSLTGDWTRDLPRTRSQHSTTRLSSRRWLVVVQHICSGRWLVYNILSANNDINHFNIFEHTYTFLYKQQQTKRWNSLFVCVFSCLDH